MIFCWSFSLCPTHMTKCQIDDSHLQKKSPNDPSVNQRSTHEGTLNEMWYSHMMAPASYIKCYRPDMWDIYMININNSYIKNLQMKNGSAISEILLLYGWFCKLSAVISICSGVKGERRYWITGLVLSVTFWKSDKVKVCLGVDNKIDGSHPGHSLVKMCCLKIMCI